MEKKLEFGIFIIMMPIHRQINKQEEDYMTTKKKTQRQEDGLSQLKDFGGFLNLLQLIRDCQSILFGQYNKNGKKIGQWDEMKKIGNIFETYQKISEKNYGN
ncbi:unnamed protein product [Paramecium sonneborni]|uniref:Uncharacterized protein n=1 Tax=Paramecium sonneborni TaxID=65129 RepID=A0A8S1QM88_9CILI|nr:unnamed protein product [Paramecium sonneborni]